MYPGFIFSSNLQSLSSNTDHTNWIFAFGDEQCEHCGVPPKKVPVKSLGSLGSVLLPSQDRNLQEFRQASWTSTLEQGEDAQERLRQDANSPPFAPFYWGVREHRNGDVGSKKVVQRMQRLIAKSVPTFMDPENAKSLFDNAEFWMGAQGILGVDKSLVESQWFCMVLFFLFIYDYVYAVYAYVLCHFLWGTIFWMGTEDLTL